MRAQLFAAFAFLCLPVACIFADDWDLPSLGFEYVDIADFAPLVENTKVRLPGKIGVVVLDVAPNGPAAGKLNMFDLITKIDQTQIKSASDMAAFLTTLQPGQECRVSGQGATTQNGVLKWKKADTKLGPSKTRRRVFIDSLVTDVDPVTDLTSYRHPNTPDGVQSTNFSLVIHKAKGGVPELRFRMSRVGNLLFTKQLLFKIDGKTIRLGVSPNVDIGDRTEWDLVEVDKELLSALLTTKSAVTVRFNGSQEYADREMPLSEIYAIRGVYQAFLAMGVKPK